VTPAFPIPAIRALGSIRRNCPIVVPVLLCATTDVAANDASIRILRILFEVIGHPAYFMMANFPMNVPMLPAST